MSALSSDSLVQALGWLVPTSVFFAGLIGSPHCVAMCGPLVMTFGREKKTLVTYHLGRMLVYTGAGALAGALGRAAIGSPSIGFSAAGLVLLALLLIVFAFRALGGSTRVHLRLPAVFARAHSALWTRVRASSPSPAVMSFIAGSLTVFLPCLHLYAFLAGAAATGSSSAGAAFMFMFWLSTVPALSAAPLLIRRFFGGSHSTTARRWAAGLFLSAAFVSLGQFAWTLREARPTDSGEATPTATSPAPAHHHHHHHH